MEYRYCWSCGQRLHEAPPTYCRRCGQRHFDNPKPCGEAVVVEDGRVLLMRRAKEPFKGAWDVPGGFCEGAEHPMHAAERELEEELGIVARAVAYVGTWIDAYGGPAADGMTEYSANSAYIMRPEERDLAVRLQAEEVLEARWFPLVALPEPLAFPDHVEVMLAAAAARLRRPLEGELPDRTW